MNINDNGSKVGKDFFKYLDNPVGNNLNKTEKSATANFADMLGKAFQDVNGTVNESDRKMVELATGESKDIHGAMIAMQKGGRGGKNLERLQEQNRIRLSGNFPHADIGRYAFLKYAVQPS